MWEGGWVCLYQNKVFVVSTGHVEVHCPVGSTLFEGFVQCVHNCKLSKSDRLLHFRTAFPGEDPPSLVKTSVSIGTIARVRCLESDVESVSVATYVCVFVFAYIYVARVGHLLEQPPKKRLHRSAKHFRQVNSKLLSRATINRLVREGTTAGVKQYMQRQQLLMDAHAAVMSYDFALFVWL